MALGRRAGLGAALAAGLLALGAQRMEAAEPDRSLAQQDEIDELRRQLSVVVDEVARLRREQGVPEEVRPLESVYGLGPAASRIYGVTRGLSLGGYAEGVYLNEIGDVEGNGENEADFTRAVLYVGYKFTNRILFNTEIEFEHGSTEREGSVSVEFAALDFLLHPALNVRTGLLLVPMGFLNEVHEPPFFLGTARPTPDRSILPTTWRENGVGIFGSFQERLHYRAYVVNGFDARGFSSAGLRDGRQLGSEALANDLGYVARVDLDLWPGARLGGSYYFGQTGQGASFDQPLSGLTVSVPDAPTSIFELHGEVQQGGLWLRGLFARARVGEAGALSRALELPVGAPVASEMLGGYAEIAYDVMPLLFPGSERELLPFFRFEYLDTQHDVPGGFLRNRGQPRRLFIPGVQFKVHPNVVLKLDYRNIEPWGGNAADVLGLGFGLAF